MPGPLLPLALLAVSTQADVTVTARKRPLEPVRDAIGYFERHCLNASRLTKRPSMPDLDPDWRELTAGQRQGFGLASRPGIVWGARLDGQALAITVASEPRPHGLVEHRCSLTVVGGDQRAYADRLAVMMRGPGTMRHLGDPAGVPRLPGWRQMLWAAIPSARTQDWRVQTTARGGETWVRVIDPSFYRELEYVVVDLRQREEGAPLALVELIYTRRRLREDAAQP